MTREEAMQRLGGPCDATTLLTIARVLGVCGVLVKKYKFEELRHYALPLGWENTRIRAIPSAHFTGE